MKILRGILIALLLSLLFGLLVGTVLQMRMQRAPVYIGSATAPGPLHVTAARSAIFDPRHREQQIRKPIQVTQQDGVERLAVVQRDAASLRAAARGARHVKGGGGGRPAR
jgi:hypothetical protein